MNSPVVIIRDRCGLSSRLRNLVMSRSINIMKVTGFVRVRRKAVRALIPRLESLEKMLRLLGCDSASGRRALKAIMIIMIHEINLI